MNYKKIMLMVLFVPLYCYGNTLEELYEQKHQKLLEIQRLQSDIVASYNNLQDSYALYRDFLCRARSELKENPEYADMSKKELNQIAGGKTAKTYDKIVNLLKSDIEQDISIDTFCFERDSDGMVDSFNVGNFLEIYGIFESDLIESFIVKYEKLINEFARIYKQIRRLEKDHEN